MSTIATCTQPDDISCGFYAGYAVSVVKNAGGKFSPALPMTNAEVESARSSFQSSKVELSYLSAGSYLQSLGVWGYRHSMTVVVSDVAGRVKKQLQQGKGLMMGSSNHWYAILAMVGSDRVAIYDPAKPPGHTCFSTSLKNVGYAKFLVHPKSW